jgi:hypothetical protein
MTHANPCLFCDGPLDGRSNKFCTKCLPPLSQWADKRDYMRHYNLMLGAVGQHVSWQFPATRLPLTHPATWAGCAECGQLTRRPQRNRLGLCSDQCRIERRRRRQRDQHRRDYKRVGQTPRNCAWCYTSFVPYNRVVTCCSTICTTRLRKQVELWRSPNSCPLPVCIDCFGVFGGRPSTTGGRMDNGNRCRECRVETSNTQLRRVARLEGDRPTIERLAARDGWHCHICYRKTRPNAQDLRRRPTIDHLIPVTSGGPDTMQNTALACWSCNSSRGVDGEVQLRLIG